jgi:hypothetical protein
MQILNNTVIQAAAGRHGLQFTNTTGMNTVRNNILLHYSASRAGLELVAAADIANVDTDYNVMDRVLAAGTLRTLAQFRTQYNKDTHSFSATPAVLFVAPASNNFDLAASSPAIDRGTTVAVASDVARRSRPQGAGYDIGAYEAPAAGSPTATPTTALTATPTVPTATARPRATATATSRPTSRPTSTPTTRPTATPTTRPTATPTTITPTPGAGTYPGYTYDLPTIRPFISLRDFANIHRHCTHCRIISMGPRPPAMFARLPGRRSRSEHVVSFAGCGVKSSAIPAVLLQGKSAMTHLPLSLHLSLCSWQ